MDVLEVTLQDLGFDSDGVLSGAALSSRGRGKPGKELVATAVRPLTLEDIERSNEAAVGVSSAPPLQELKSRHHRLARLLAEGHKHVYVSRMTGYSESRISILMRDPAFVNLVDQYKSVVEDKFADTVEKMKNLTEDAIDLLAERLDTDPASITNSMAVELIKTVGDRAGFSPVSKSISVSASLDPQRLADVKARVNARRVGEVKQITQEVADAEFQVVQEDQGTEECEAALGTPEPVQDQPKT